MRIRSRKPPGLPSEQRCSHRDGIASTSRSVKPGSLFEGSSSYLPICVNISSTGRYAHIFGPVSTFMRSIFISFIYLSHGHWLVSMTKHELYTTLCGP